MKRTRLENSSIARLSGQGTRVVQQFFRQREHDTVAIGYQYQKPFIRQTIIIQLSIQYLFGGETASSLAGCDCSFGEYTKCEYDNIARKFLSYRRTTAFHRIT